MSRRELARRYAGWFVLVFAFGFVLRAGGLLLHEFGGHGFVAAVAGCGIDGWDLTYFGYGSVSYAPCESWTPLGMSVASWAGLGVCLAVGMAAAVVARRPRLAPLPRFLWAMTGFFFLMGQLGYVVVGSFFRMGDPAETALALDAHGLAFLMWGGGLVATLLASLVTARAAVLALRELFAPRDRLRTVLVLALVVGAPGLLFATCLELEHRTRAGVTGARGAREATWEREVAEALAREQAQIGRALTDAEITRVRRAHRPFPIGLVQLGVAAGGVSLALASRRGLGLAGPSLFVPPPPRVLPITVAAAAVLAAVLAALMSAA